MSTNPSNPRPARTRPRLRNECKSRDRQTYLTITAERTTTSAAPPAWRNSKPTRQNICSRSPCEPVRFGDARRHRPPRPCSSESITQASPRPARTRRRLRLPHVPRSPRKEARSLPLLRHGPRTRSPRRRHAHRIHLPHASGDRAPRARFVPDLRHGPRAPHRHRRRRRKSRTARHDPPLLDRASPSPRRCWRSPWAQCSGKHAVAPRSLPGCSICPGSNSRSPRPSCSGADCHSSSASGLRSSTAARTCSR